MKRLEKAFDRIKTPESWKENLYKAAYAEERAANKLRIGNQLHGRHARDRVFRKNRADRGAKRCRHDQRISYREIESSIKARDDDPKKAQRTADRLFGGEAFTFDKKKRKTA